MEVDGLAPSSEDHEIHYKQVVNSTSMLDSSRESSICYRCFGPPAPAGRRCGRSGYEALPVSLGVDVLHRPVLVILRDIRTTREEHPTPDLVRNEAEGWLDPKASLVRVVNNPGWISSSGNSKISATLATSCHRGPPMGGKRSSFWARCGLKGGRVRPASEGGTTKYHEPPEPSLTLKTRTKSHAAMKKQHVHQTV